MDESQLNDCIQCLMCLGTLGGAVFLFFDVIGTFGDIYDSICIAIEEHPGRFNHEYREWLDKQEEWYWTSLSMLSASFPGFHHKSVWDLEISKELGKMPFSRNGLSLSDLLLWNVRSVRDYMIKDGDCMIEHNLYSEYKDYYQVWKCYHRAGLMDFRLFVYDKPYFATWYDLGVRASDENDARRKILENINQINHWFDLKIDEDQVNDCKVKPLEETLGEW